MIFMRPWLIQERTDILRGNIGSGSRNAGGNRSRYRCRNGSRNGSRNEGRNRGRHRGRRRNTRGCRGRRYIVRIIGTDKHDLIDIDIVLAVRTAADIIVRYINTDLGNSVHHFRNCKLLVAAFPGVVDRLDIIHIDHRISIMLVFGRSDINHFDFLRTAIVFVMAVGSIVAVTYPELGNSGVRESKRQFRNVIIHFTGPVSHIIAAGSLIIQALIYGVGILLRVGSYRRDSLREQFINGISRHSGYCHGTQRHHNTEKKNNQLFHVCPSNN